MHDLRIGIRTLSRTPGFTIVALLVMALGIGANVALFTVVRSILLKPLRYSDPERLALIYEAVTVNCIRRRGFPWMRAASGNGRGRLSRSRRWPLISPFQGYNVSGEGGNVAGSSRSGMVHR